MGVAFVFPGQGSQYPAMGRDLAACSRSARARVAIASEVTGLDLGELMATAGADELADPRVAQLVVFVWSSVVFDDLRQRWPVPDVVAGHSLGEYTALVACGSLDWHDALSLIAFRGAAMADAARQRPGAMGAVVGLSADAVAELCAAVPEAVIANINSPRQTVVAGPVEAVEAVLDAARDACALRARRLPVGGAYHSPLMEPAKRRLAPLLRDVPLRPPGTTFVSSVTGEPVTDLDAYRELLTEQVTGPVRWQDVVRRLVALGPREYVEAGPGRVLSGLIREQDRTARQIPALQGLRTPAGVAS